MFVFNCMIHFVTCTRNYLPNHGVIGVSVASLNAESRPKSGTQDLKYFYCFISMETCWKGFKFTTFETKLFFENVGKISMAMGRTILKYIYPWSVLHTFTIRWISTLDMTLVRSYHMGKFTSSYLQFSKNLASQGLLCST